ncbi:MAG: ATP-binding protein [Lachnospiraceae bacterium]|nr:ATP-binding protein [Lachnospiraceae bacterium]
MKNKRNGERLLSNMESEKTGEEACPGKDTEQMGMERDSKTQKKMRQEEMLPEEMRFEAVTADIERATGFVNQYLEALDCPMNTQVQIDIAIDELFGNIVHYAYPNGSGPVWVRAEVETEAESDNVCAGAEPGCASTGRDSAYKTERKTIILTFRDCGIPYDPLARKDPDTALPLEEREPGGLGIYMVKQSMDVLSYEYKDGKNILTVKKTLIINGAHRRARNGCLRSPASGAK